MAVTVKRAESALFVIFGTDKLYEGTASVPKIKRLGKVTLRLKAKKYLPP